MTLWKFLFLHVKVSTWTEAVLLESESDSTSIELYLTIDNIKVNFESLTFIINKEAYTDWSEKQMTWIWLFFLFLFFLFPDMCEWRLGV